jgi:hypothetical protein
MGCKNSLLENTKFDTRTGSRMKLERERDIPAFKGKSWRERMALRDRAKERDHSIFWLQMLCGLVIFAPIIAFSHWLGVRLFPHSSFLAFVAIYFGLSYPAITVFDGLFITPRIRRALELDSKPAA